MNDAKELVSVMITLRAGGNRRSFIPCDKPRSTISSGRGGSGRSRSVVVDRIFESIAGSGETMRNIALFTSRRDRIMVRAISQVRSRRRRDGPLRANREIRPRRYVKTELVRRETSMTGMVATRTGEQAGGSTSDLDLQIMALLRKEIQDKDAVLTRETRRDEVAIDSIDIVNVVFAVEEKYDVEINLTPQDRFETVGDLIDALVAFIPEEKR
jgi:acyl carrier protein